MNYTVKKKPQSNFFMPHFGNILNEVMNTSIDDLVKNAPKSYTTPAVNISKNDEQYQITVALPGYSKKDVALKIENNKLIISSEVKKETEANFRLREFNFGPFKRSFNLAKNIDQDSIQASFKNGLLNVTLLKKPEAKPKSISIK